MRLLNNYQIFLTVSQENSELQKKQIQALLSMRVDGIIISISQDTHQILKFLKLQGIDKSLSFHGSYSDLINCNTVTVDDRGGGL